jgi:hypothetical protein
LLCSQLQSSRLCLEKPDFERGYKQNRKNLLNGGVLPKETGGLQDLLRNFIEARVDLLTPEAKLDEQDVSCDNRIVGYLGSLFPCNFLVPTFTRGANAR